MSATTILAAYDDACNDVRLFRHYCEHEAGIFFMLSKDADAFVPLNPLDTTTRATLFSAAKAAHDAWCDNVFGDGREPDRTEETQFALGRVLARGR